jgi:hypothetical protein
MIFKADKQFQMKCMHSKYQQRSFSNYLLEQAAKESSRISSSKSVEHDACQLNDLFPQPLIYCIEIKWKINIRRTAPAVVGIISLA